jgi:adenylate cyclase, class 2
MQEMELKFLNIDVPAMQAKLAGIGAVKEYEGEMAETYFDNEPLNVHHHDLDKHQLRLRTWLGKTVLTYKAPAQKSALLSREEHEVTVDDEKEMVRILKSLGFVAAVHLKKHRIHYTLKDCSCEIDTWNGIPPFLEIETHSKEEMQAICTKLGLRLEDGHGKTVLQLYPHINNALPFR